MEIEHVARIGFAARRTAEQQRHLTISHGLLRKIIIDNERVHAVVAEPLAHGAARERRKILQRRRIARGRGDDGCVFHRAGVFERLDDLRDRRALLPDGDVDAIELLLLVGTGVDGALIDDGVNGDGGLAGLTVADDELALATADRDQAVDRLDARLHGLVHGFARNDARRLHVDATALGNVLQLALAVDRIAETIDYAAEKTFANRHVDDGARALHRVAFFDRRVGAEDHDADIVALEIERHAFDAARELDHLAGLDIVEAIDAGDAVADRKNLADFADFRLSAEILDFALQDCRNLGGLDVHFTVLSWRREAHQASYAKTNRSCAIPLSRRDRREAKDRPWHRAAHRGRAWI